MGLSCPGLVCIPRGAPLRLAAHQGRSTRSSLLSTPVCLGLRSLGDAMDLGWQQRWHGWARALPPKSCAGKERGNQVGDHPSAQRMATPDTWLLLFPGFAPGPHSSAQCPTSSLAPPRARLTPVCSPPAAPSGDSWSDALKLLGVWRWGMLGAPELAQAGTTTSPLVEGTIPAVGIPTARGASTQED